MSLPQLILPSHLARVGEDRHKLVTLCNKGTLTRIRRGVYVESKMWTELSATQQYGLKAAAFQQLAGRQPVLCHESAALLWGLWIVGTPRKLHVMTDVTGGGRNSNGVVRHRGSLSDGTLGCGPFLLTDKLTTTLQLIGSLDFSHAVAVCDSSLHPAVAGKVFNRFVTAGTEPEAHEPFWQSTYPQGAALLVQDLLSAAAELPSKSATQRATSVINFASSLSGSAGESLSRAKMHMFGFPPPTLQQHFRLRDGTDAYVDFWFEELKLVGEFDGQGKYLRADWGSGLSIQDRVMKEKAREDAIRAQGVRFVRWDWREMMNNERFIFLLRQAGLRQS